ncbi:MAG: hypothetical protein HY042_00750, partial [Spirochaetia bacterium]|nr:hypothetical protein [Spirochaetia bacterium]
GQKGRRTDQAGGQGGEGELQFADAPRPDSDPELAEQIRTLWPHALKPQKDNREEVRKQWQDFAKQYPDNVYLPDEYRAVAPTDEQKSVRRKTMELVTSVDAKIASQRAALKQQAKPGQNGPSAPSVPDVTPQEQKQYFNYKMSELSSRIQLVQYMLANGSPDAQQKAQAQKDIAAWNKELNDYRQVMAQIPEK